MVAKVNELKNIHYMAGYGPFDPQYSRYIETPEVLAAGYKIVDVYTAICQARAHLLYYECHDFGQLANKNDDISMKWAKSQMCIDAIIYYNIAIDLSWQVIWAFYQPTSLKFLYQNKYEEISKECTLEAVNTLLDYVIKTEPIPSTTIASNIKNELNVIINDKLIDEIHRYYNYLKHRGGYYIPGLGENYKYLSLAFGEKKVPILSRPELNIEELYQKLLKFDVKFIEHFESIIEMIIPKDYMKSNVELGALIGNYDKIIDAIISEE